MQNCQSPPNVSFVMVNNGILSKRSPFFLPKIYIYKHPANVNESLDFFHRSSFETRTWTRGEEYFVHENYGKDTYAFCVHTRWDRKRDKRASLFAIHERNVAKHFRTLTDRKRNRRFLSYAYQWVANIGGINIFAGYSFYERTMRDGLFTIVCIIDNGWIELWYTMISGEVFLFFLSSRNVLLTILVEELTCLCGYSIFFSFSKNKTIKACEKVEQRHDWTHYARINRATLKSFVSLFSFLDTQEITRALRIISIDNPVTEPW